MNAALKSLIALAIGATGFSVASLRETPPQPAGLILTSNISYSMHHRTGSHRSTYVKATDPNVGEVKYIVGPSKAAVGDEAQFRLRPSDNLSALEIESNDGAVYADCKSLTLAKADSLVKSTTDERTKVMRDFNIPWWVFRTKSAAAGADGTDIIMQRFFNGDPTNPKNEVTRILFLGPAGSSVRTAWWDENKTSWEPGPSLTVEKTYTELKYVNNKWEFGPVDPIIVGTPNDSDVEKLLIRMTNLKTRAVDPALDDPNNGS